MLFRSQDFLAQHLCIKNVVLNVSGVLWRRSALLQAMDRCGDALFDFKVAGDWFLYATAAAAGHPVAYVATALNGHRRHATSVTHALAKQRHFDEIVRMQEFCADCASLSTTVRTQVLGYRAEVADYLGISST